MAAIRKIDDAGVKIGGARKDWRDNLMSAADVAAMTDAEKALLVKKDRVWPQPDYLKLVEGGMEPEAAALVKIIRDGMAATPRVTRSVDLPAAAAAYVEMVGVIRDVLTACRTVADVKDASTVIFARIGYDRMNRGSMSFETKVLANSVVKGTSYPFFVDTADYRKAVRMVAEGFAAEVPAWRKGVRAISYSGQVILMSGKSPVTRDRFATEEEAWAWLEKDYANKLAAKKDVKEGKVAPEAATGPSEPKRPHLEKLTRSGPDHRGGAGVSADTFLTAFGFKGIEFGLWLPDGERQEVLNLGFDACMDLAWALGIEPSQIGMNGRLSSAFGARGQGGAAAHYEPGRTVVNLTRLSGAGSLAHEYGHALDHVLGVMGGPQTEGKSPRFASGYHTLYSAPRIKALPDLPPEVSSSVDAVMQSMINRPILRDESIANCEKSKADLLVKITKHEQAKEAHLANQAKPDRKWLREVDAWVQMARIRVEGTEERLTKMREAPADAAFGVTPSSFYQEAVALAGGGDYWKRPTELVARAFESVVFDRLEAAGRHCDYLVHGVRGGVYQRPAHKGDPYPDGEERARIGVAFADLFSHIGPLLQSRAEPVEEQPIALRA